MVNIVPYEADKHFELLKSWILKRDLPLTQLECLPAVGFVGYYENTPVGVGFLRNCEGVYGVLDGLLTDCEISGNVRSQVLDLITENILDFGSKMGMRAVIAWSTDKNTLLRATRHGFEVTNQVFITRLLSK